MSVKLIKGAIVLFWSSLKYMVGLFCATSFNLGFIPSVLITVAGGMAGFFIFAFLGVEIRMIWHRYILGRKHHPLMFSKHSRRLVWFKNRFGLTSIALLTPILLQVPIGALLAVNVTKNFKKVSLYMLCSFTMYSVVFCGLYYSLHINVPELVRSWIHGGFK
jgi:hypothetical protein